MPLHLPLKHPTRPNIRRLKCDQIILGERLIHARKKAIGLTQPGPIQGITDGTSVGKKWKLATPSDVITEGFNGLSTEPIVLVLKQEFGNRHQFRIAVVREVEMVSDA